jgi:signal transduction histidine kinase
VSHELRTPLTSIQGFAEFILEATSDKLPDLAREYTEIILSSAKRLKTIFDEMIQITRADAGKLQLNKEDAHLPDLIIDVGAQMELQYKQRKQQLLLDLDDDLPPVNIDVTKITQVLVNLMTNAIKYSPEGGKISVSTRLVSGIEALPEDAPKDIVLPAILVSISDDGKGLSREEADQVFMPFFRTEEARKNKIEGVGLGLAVTRSIIEVHRGKIWAVPRPRAEGGCFQLTLPTVRG